MCSFIYSNGNVYSRWIGKCEKCNQWNTLVEENNSKPSGILSKSTGKKLEFKKLNDVNYEYSRIKTNLNELDRVIVGLSGEIRKVNQPELRIKEASKLGFNKINFPTKQKVIINKDMRYNSLSVLSDLVELINKDYR